uniref:t-SNARE coiled-coil homology domain-containing protein n=1 Tax=Entomoneis paludosa TaxID=265537 RepID=A0A7S2YCR6_9STRA|mmetsp:Transcript_27574/g.57711  ORF Transcript_27574/g.57711 Transcript_27574/m.57711 type:complete len:221 (+) Transcript_27574:73-735(+)
MTTIGELFPKCNKLAYDARQQLLQMQQQHQSGTNPDLLFLVLDDLEKQLNIMEEDMVLREAPAQREKWKRKIRDLRAEAQTLRQQGQTVSYQYQQRQQQTSSYQSEREELLRRRHRQRPNGGESDVDQLAAEGESLEQSHRMVSQLIDQGSANLYDLQKQRQQMRGIRGMLTDISNSLGLTQSTMRIIERRDITDAYLVAVMMVVTLLVLYFVWIVEYGE